LRSLALSTRLLEARKQAPLVLSIGVQFVLALFWGHAHDMRVFLATGYLVGTGQNPHVAQDLSAVFHDTSFQGMSTVGYPPPWSLLLGLAYLASYKLAPNLLAYNFAIKIPIIAGNISLAYLVANILRSLGADEDVAHRARLFLLFNPFLLYASSAWGQFDSIVALLALLALLLLSTGRLTSSAILLALAFSFKPIALPLVPAALLYLRRTSLQRVLKYSSILSLCALLFVVGPFILLNWDPTPIIEHWNGHFIEGGGMSFLTFLELTQDSYRLPGLWWLVGMLWAPAVGLAILALRPSGEGLLDLLAKSTALIMVFFLSRSWLSEPNIILVLPFVLILTSMGALDRRTLTAVWVLPLVFGFFNTSMFQLLFPSMPSLMDRLLQSSDVFRTARLFIRTIVVIPWLIVGGWIVGQCLRSPHVFRIRT